MDDNDDSPLTPKENKVAAAATIGLLLLVGAALVGGVLGVIGAAAGGSLYAYAIYTAVTSGSDGDRPTPVIRRADAAASDNTPQPITLQPDAPSQHWQQHVEAQAKTTARTR